jgi:nucleoside-diphosphate-sugar epimerase
METHILVTGATGNVGLPAVRELVSRGVKVAPTGTRLGPGSFGSRALKSSLEISGGRSPSATRFVISAML